MDQIQQSETPQKGGERKALSINFYGNRNRLIETQVNKDSTLIFLVEEVQPSPRRIQRVQHFPEPRTRVRLPQKFRNRGKDQQNSMAEEKEPRTFPPLH